MLKVNFNRVLEFQTINICYSEETVFEKMQISSQITSVVLTYYGRSESLFQIIDNKVILTIGRLILN